jgi:chemotaxis response regulator CheB
MRELLSRLPADFPAAIAIVSHRGAEEPERLINILSKATRLRVCHAEDGVLLQAGTVYVCPPHVHMTTEHCLRLFDGPRIRFVRPSADLMLESAARTHGDRALGVVLSGANTDAALGSLAIAQAGGLVLTQDENGCEFAEMPSGTARLGINRTLAPSAMAEALQRWALSGAEYLPRDTPQRLAAQKTRVLLVDDHRILLEGLRILLEGELDMQVLALADTGLSAVTLALELAPDVVVMDIRMPLLDGIEATRQILKARPATKIVALSSESEAGAINKLFAAGATGYLTKSHAFGELVQAIRSVVAGGAYLSREVARLVVAGSVTAPPPADKGAPRVL